MSFNFFSLPYLLQKRFVEIADAKTVEKFFKINKNTAEFSKFRIIVDKLVINNSTDLLLSKKITPENYKKVEIIDYIILFDIVPPYPWHFGYFEKISIYINAIHFSDLKTIVDHPHLKIIKFHGDLKAENETQEIKQFFDRLLTFEYIRFSIKTIYDENAFNIFKSIAKTYETRSEILIFEEQQGMRILTKRVNLRRSKAVS